MRVLVIMVLMIISLPLYSEKAEENTKTAKTLPKREYTNEEFEKAVTKELEKRLKRLGHGKVVEFSKELVQKQQELDLKKIKTEKEDEQLKLSMKNFDKKVKEFRQKQEKLLVCMDEIHKKESKRVEHMVDTVSNMRPQNAADVLSVQDPGISVKILSELPATKVAKIFNLMDKEISARLQKQYLTMKR